VAIVSGLFYLSIGEAAELVRQQRVSPVELVEDCLRRIDELNPKLNAFAKVVSASALEQAERAESEIKRGGWRGPLHGIPVGVKDFFDTAGVTTTAAFEPMRERVPARDAALVAKLKEAGAIIVGKMNMHALGMGTTSVDSCFGPVHNPWNVDHVAGGSSGGSAAAVAAGLCFATVDTDAIGSCRLPAACCGVVGFKATFGLLSTQGILDGEPVDEGTARMLSYFGHSGFTCRTVDDAAILLNALSTRDVSEGEFERDYRMALPEKPLGRVGVVKGFRASAEMRDLFERAAEVLRSVGYEMVDVDAPLGVDFSFRSIDRDRREVGDRLFPGIDALILPTLTDVAPRIAEVMQSGDTQAVSADNTIFCNYYGLPAITVPCGLSDGGLPVGLQVVGAPCGEDAVLRVANSFQRATEWHLKRPVD
jgi:aspartyl-tRNA(Asn)/glutamyl-tRNA(Gln) amidotransferase subunit A